MKDRPAARIKCYTGDMRTPGCGFRPSHLLYTAGICAVLLAGASCGRTNQKTPAAPRASDAKPADLEAGREVAGSVPVPVSLEGPESQEGGEAASLPLITGLASEEVPEHLAAELASLDPTADGWETEAFSTQALAQLKALGHAITDADTIDAAALGPFVAAGFQCTRLPPATLATIFKDEEFHARRSAREALSTASHETLSGAEGLARAARELLAAFAEASELTAHVKVVGVERQGDAWSTKAYVQFAGRTRSGSIQQTSVWQCGWTVASATNLQSVPDPPLLVSLQIDELTEVAYSGGGQTLYVDKTGQLLGGNASYRQQLVPELEHWRDSVDWRFGLDVASPYGLAVGDANGDDLDDVLICEPGGLPNRLYLQNADGTAVDVSAEAGVDFLEPCESALFLDLDNDGDQDLVIASGRNLLVLENEGAAKFHQRDARRLAGLPRTICAADFDADGRLDIYVANYLPHGAAAMDVGIATPMPMHDANNGPPNHLLRNAEDWRFEDVTADVGLDVNNRRYSYAAAWEDFDNDGDVDLYVANDFGRNNLYRNDGGRFVDIAAQAEVEDMASGMSVSWGDYNHDGLMDLYVGNMFSSAGNRIAYQRRFKEGASDETVDRYRRFARGNTLFQNTGNGTFRDVTEEAQVAMGRWAWGSLFVDVNNDSWQDLVVGNGFITGRQTLDDL